MGNLKSNFSEVRGELREGKKKRFSSIWQEGGSSWKVQERSYKGGPLCGHPQKGERLGGMVERIFRQRELHVEVCNVGESSLTMSW